MTELITHTGIPIKEAKAEMEVHPLIVQITISGQCKSKVYNFFYNFYSLILFDLFPQIKKFPISYFLHN